MELKRISHLELKTEIKRSKKQEAVIKSLQGSMSKFVTKVNSSGTENLSTQREEDEDKDEVVDDIGQNEEPGNSEECQETYQDETENQDEKIKEQRNKDVSDPGNWENIDMGFRDLLVKEGPATRLSSHHQFPKESIDRHFSHVFYTRDMILQKMQEDLYFCNKCFYINVFL